MDPIPIKSMHLPIAHYNGHKSPVGSVFTGRWGFEPINDLTVRGVQIAICELLNTKQFPGFEEWGRQAGV